MAAKFEWDRRKAKSNLSKHGVSFDEALTVFADPLAKIFDDVDRSATEPREIIVGYSLRQRLLLVCFIANQDVIRVISARKATRRERQDYEENVKS
jgi:uncharacterized DUF497 family protein